MLEWWHNLRRPPIQRLAAGIAAMLLVVSGVASVIVRTQMGSGDTKMGGDDIALLAVLGLISLVLVPLTWTWRIWLWEAGLATLAWVFLIGPAGDTSCTDCAFVLLLPLGLVGLQTLLYVVGWLSPELRRADWPGKHQEHEA